MNAIDFHDFPRLPSLGWEVSHPRPQVLCRPSAEQPNADLRLPLLVLSLLDHLLVRHDFAHDLPRGTRTAPGNRAAGGGHCAGDGIGRREACDGVFMAYYASCF